MEPVKRITLVIGADHRGFALKEFLKQQHLFGSVSVTWQDVGCFNDTRCDYPQFAQAACQLLLQEPDAAGILICGSGIGMAIAANRLKGIYAGVAWSPEIAQAAREDDNVNVLVLPADYITHKETPAIITAWLNAEFKEGRYAQRLQKIDQ